MNIDNTVQGLVTLENAKAWDTTDEQYIFCIDVLHISAHHPAADRLVNELETAFAARLKRHYDRLYADIQAPTTQS